MISWKKPGLIADNNPILPWIHLQNVIFPTLIAIVSTMATVVASDSIQGSLAISDSLMQWVTTLYLLGANTAVPAANWFADKYGYKRMYFISIVIFTLATFFSAIAFGFWSLVLARFIEGVGAGMIFSIGLAIITHAFPKEKIGIAVLTYFALSFGGGLMLGTFLSGYLDMYFEWRATFWICLPNGIIALIIVWLYQNETESKHNLKFDYFGYLFFIAFIAFLLIPLTNGNLKSTADGWRSPYIIGCFLLSALSLVATIVIERKKEHPIIPLSLFKDPLFSVGCATLFVVGLAIFSSISLMIDYMQDALFYDKFRSGLTAISYGLGFAIFTTISSILMQRISATMIALVGLGILIGSYFLNNILTFQSGKVAITMILLTRAMGVSFILGPITAQSLRNVPKEMQEAGATMLTFFRQVGSTYGGTVLGILIIRRNIFHTQRFAEPVNAALPGFQANFKQLTTHIIDTTGASVREAQAQAKSVIIQNIKIQSYIQSINDGFIVFAYFTIGIALLLIFFNVRHYLKANPLSRDGA